MQKQLPFLFLLLPFVIGIFCMQNIFCHVNMQVLEILFATSIFVYILFQFRSHYFLYKNSALNGVILFCILFLFGAVLSRLNEQVQHQKHYSHWLTDSSTVVATVLDPVIPKTKSYKTRVAITKIINQNIASNTVGDALIYFTKMDSMPAILPGNKLVIQSKFLQIKNNGNWGEFDYKNYCNLKGITHMAFVQPKHYQLCSTNAFSITAFFSEGKIFTLGILRKYIPNPETIGMAEALLIGDKTDIDQDTWDAYSRTGIVHIIAISGMHMGIIYQSFIWLFSFLPFLKNRKRMVILLALVLMWGFAMLTGIPPSVMRAAVMFTILGVGKMLNRNSNTFNSLAVSAFILLCYNPLWLQDVGFQLSYASVLSIMLFASKIKNRLFFKNKIIQEFWVMISATLAAQIFTFPLCLYYFHQFPLLFLFANMVAIPLTTFILYLEIALFCLSFIKPVAIFIGKIISGSIILLNYCINGMSHVKGLTIYDVYISQVQLYFLMAFVLLFCYALWHKQSSKMILALSCLFVFYGIKCFTLFGILQQKKLIVYNIPKTTMLDCIAGNTYNLCSTDSIKASDVKNAVTPTHTLLQSNNESKNTLPKIETSNYILFTFCHKKIVVLKNNAVDMVENTPINYVILSDNTKTPLSTIIEKCQPKYIIADASNSLWKINKWKEECKNKQTPFWSTSQDGAFLESF